jgi:hypothetical protein
VKIREKQPLSGEFLNICSNNFFRFFAGKQRDVRAALLAF